MRLDDFDYPLPEELIALRPARPRPSSRLLVATPGTLRDSIVARLPDFLERGDLLVFNDTRVIPARLAGVRRRASGAEARASRSPSSPPPPKAPGGRWPAPASAWPRATASTSPRPFPPTSSPRTAPRSSSASTPPAPPSSARSTPSARCRCRPTSPPAAPPTPPTAPTTRPSSPNAPGAVAAPTASLHFDAPLLAALAARGVAQTRLTLHVGAGTFLPVKVEDIETHRMHAEWGEIGPAAADTINATRAAGGRVIPVGTTALRLIETAATGAGRVAPFTGETDIFIRPGYDFRIADALMTNFHLPKSTLLMLVSALMGARRIREIYAHAIASRYRFFSYGDASLLLPGG